MRKSNRLIKDFKKQDRFSIWKHMESMAVNYAVYSELKTNVEPYLVGKNVYIYVSEENMVVVCLDCYKEKEKPTYEESGSIVPVILNPGQEPRESMVWKLREMMILMERRLEACHFDLSIYGVLLTEARITNADDLEDVWEANNIRVFEGYRDLRHRRAEVNADYGLHSRIYLGASLDKELDAVLDETGKREAPKPIEEDDEDKLDKLLDQFIDGTLEPPSREDSILAYLEDTLEDDEDSADDEAPDMSETPEDEDTSEDDVSLPDGVIEQNQTLCVQVKILSPIVNPREELDKLLCYVAIKTK